MLRDDLILRMIERAAHFVARAAGVRVADEQEDDRDGDPGGDYGSIYAELLDANRPFLDVVDAETLYRLMGAPERALALAAVCATEARVLADVDPGLSLRRREMARGLANQARRDRAASRPAFDAALTDIES